MRAIIAAAALETVAAAARTALPDECCGLLEGTRLDPACWRITAAHPAANIAPPPRHDRFEVDPAVHLKLQQALRGTGRAVVGHYHSHPTGIAQPSAADWAQVADPNLVWLIAATDGDDMHIAAFAVGEDGFVTVKLDVETD